MNTDFRAVVSADLLWSGSEADSLMHLPAGRQMKLLNHDSETQRRDFLVLGPRVSATRADLTAVVPAIKRHALSLHPQHL